MHIQAQASAYFTGKLRAVKIPCPSRGPSPCRRTANDQEDTAPKLRGVRGAPGSAGCCSTAPHRQNAGGTAKAPTARAAGSRNRRRAGRQTPADGGGGGRVTAPPRASGERRGARNSPSSAAQQGLNPTSPAPPPACPAPPPRFTFVLPGLAPLRGEPIGRDL